MRNTNGMILIESLLFFMICVMLISLLIGMLLTSKNIQEMERRGYQDEELQDVYQYDDGFYAD